MKKDLKGREYLQKGSAIFRVGDEIIAAIGDTDYITEIKKLFDDGYVEIGNGMQVHINNIVHQQFTMPVSNVGTRRKSKHKNIQI